MTTKHTPGPWALTSTGNAHIIKASVPVALTLTADCYAEEAEANARLIAAAPELLAALKEFVAWQDAPIKGNGRAFYLGTLDRIAREAIAKAES